MTRLALAPVWACCALLIAASPPTVHAQTCLPSTPDRTPCDDDLDPCTDDRCDDGVCAHTPVGFVAACTPILVPFQRVVVLVPYTTDLAARVTALPTGDPPAFTDGQRDAIAADLAEVGARLDALRRTLGGLDDAIDDTAQRRAITALPDAEAAVRTAVLVRSLVRVARAAEQFAPGTARVLDRSTADLVRGAKAIRRDLTRLRRVSQVFQS